MRLVRLLALLLISLPVVVSTTASSASAGCYGVGCDNAGPQAQGCWGDGRRIGWTADNNLRLMYSPSCHAFWAWTTYGNGICGSEVQLEMEHLEFISANTQGWVVKRRLVTGVAPDNPGEWTNMLGARNNDFRFRAVWSDPHCSGNAHFTPYARGGAQ